MTQITWFGVMFYLCKKGNTGVVAHWSDLKDGVRTKSFAVKKYGLLPAFAMAVEYREKMIAELNLQGAGYSEQHGLKRKNPC
ncbi:MAG: hypothetical protein ACRDBG_15515 [Waterburya sp.]